MTQYHYSGSLVRAIDGDTVVLKLVKDYTLSVDFGFHIIDEIHLHKTTVQTFRLLGIDTPEVVGENKQQGLEAKTELVRLLSLGTIRVVSEKIDKYGRWLATIYVTQPDGIEFNVNQKLVESGHATIYTA